MSALSDLPELVGFFSYSRDDDEDSHGALSALRDRIQRELRGQLGRSMKTFRLWQDKEAIAPGKLWESEIQTGVEQAVFFIPIITPTVVRSPYCKFELDSFLAREQSLGRSDLVFPILYLSVHGLEDEAQRRNDPVLSIVAKRQYVDWRELRYEDINATEAKRAVAGFCAHIVETLRKPWVSPEERQQEAQRLAQEVQRGREEEHRRKIAAEAERQHLEREAAAKSEADERAQKTAAVEVENQRHEREGTASWQAERQQAIEPAEGDQRIRETEAKPSQANHFISDPRTKDIVIWFMGCLIAFASVFFLAANWHSPIAQISSSVRTPDADPPQAPTPSSYSGQRSPSGRPVLQFDAPDLTPDPTPDAAPPPAPTPGSYSGQRSPSGRPVLKFN
jgi:hypothetical protein